MFLQLLWNAVTVGLTLLMQWALEALRHWLRTRRSPSLPNAAGQLGAESTGLSSARSSGLASGHPESRPL